MKIIYKKCHPEPFQAIWDRRKRHEVREFDEEYAEGDTLILQEYDQVFQRLLGREISCRIGYITPPGSWGLPPTIGAFTITDITPYFSGSRMQCSNSNN